MSKRILVPAQISAVRPLNDGSFSVTFHTNELGDADKLVLVNALNMVGWALLSENEVGEEDIPVQDSEFESKTPSQRFRGVLFILWKQTGEVGDFDNFYKTEMEKIINHFKNKLDKE